MTKLEVLIHPIASLPSVTRTAVLQFLQNFSFTSDVLKESAQFSDDRPYGRRLLVSTSTVEVLLMGFHPGRECPPHDHGEADGLVLVCHGNARHKVYQRKANSLKLVADTIEPAGSILDAPVDCVHSMGNASETEPLITLHVYWPPIHKMSVFDMNEKRIYIVNDKAGAWLPVDPATLLETQELK